MKNIYLSIHNGLEARNLLRLGMLERLLDTPDVRVIVVTRAYCEPEFRAEFASERVWLAPQKKFSLGRVQNNLMRLRWKYVHNRKTLALWWALESRLLPHDLYQDVFREYLPTLVVVNPRNIQDIPLALNARWRRVPTLGLVASWDNIAKRLPVRTDKIAVWNPINRDEVVNLELYRPQDVYVVGAPQFDPYFADDILMPRSDFLRSLGLNPDKKTILVPTSATSLAGTQTFILDTLVTAAREGSLVAPIQVVCRPYPRDWLGPYVKYLRSQEVYLDLIPNWNRVLETMMGYTDVRHMANLLRHSDVMVNFATTVTLEAAIFDTPAILAAYSDVDQGQLQDYLVNWHFEKHFREIVDRDLVPIVRNEEQLIEWINRYLLDPGLYREQRQQIVADWIYYTDGRSSERIANLILRLSENSKEQ